MTRAGLLPSRRARRLALLLVLLALVGFLLLWGPRFYLPGYGFPGSHDFIQYWSAARLLMHGGNPYDPAALLAVEQAAGWPEAKPLLMWNPPWTLALLLPLAPLSYGVATLVWLFLQLSLILGSGVLLWRYFAPGDNRFWIGMVLAVAFTPSLSALRIGQISPWLLLGVAGFLWAQRGHRDLLAGASLALLMIKPHIAYLFWLAALWWALRSRRPRILAGWLAALAAATGLVVLCAPSILANYLAAMSGPPLEWLTPTLGTWLGVLSGLEQRWLRFLPPLLGMTGLGLWLWRRRGPWRWRDTASPLLLASVLTAPFGWSFDQIVLLPIVVDLVARLRGTPPVRQAVVLGLLASFQVVLMVQYHMISDHFAYWHPLALAGLYWWGGRRAPTRGQGEMVSDLPTRGSLE
jgi:hypothetical protein